MLKYLGEAAELVIRAMERIVAEGRTLTPGFGDSASTDEVASAVIVALGK